MKKRVKVWGAALLGAVLVTAAGVRMTPAAGESSTDEQQIRTLQNRLAASVHHLAHISWTSKRDGSHHEQLMSMTDGYRKINGKWLIVLEHFSLPVVDGKAVPVAWPKD